MCPKDSAGNSISPSAMRVRVRREKRRGKWTTVVAGLTLDKAGCKAMLKELRTHLGTGGGLSDAKDATELILQGDHREKTVTFLKENGYDAKAAGG